MNLPKRFEQAKEASRFSTLYQHKMGAAVFYKKYFLAAGFNTHKTDPFTHKFEHAFTMHSELHALKKAKSKKFDLTNTTIMVYREKKDGTLGMARPCEMCLEAIKLHGVKWVYFTTEAGWERLRI